MTAQTEEIQPVDEGGVWIVVLGDLFIFGLFFCTFMYYRAFSPALFESGRQALDMKLAIVNTLFLVTSSYFVVVGLQGFNAGKLKAGQRHFLVAATLGLAFVVVKIIEYRGKILDGISPATSDFYMFYFTLTGIHLLHVLIGLLILGLMIYGASPARTGVRPDIMESGGLFWHLVDVLWLILFPLLYLVR